MHSFSVELKLTRRIWGEMPTLVCNFEIACTFILIYNMNFIQVYEEWIKICRVWCFLFRRGRWNELENYGEKKPWSHY